MDKKETETEAPEETSSRLDLLKQIGVALTVVSLGSLSTLASAGQQRDDRKQAIRPSGKGNGKQIKLRPTKLSELDKQLESKNFHVWLVTGQESASIVAVPSDQLDRIRSTQSQLGGAPAFAMIKDGIVQVNTGPLQEMESNCFNGSGNGNSAKVAKFIARGGGVKLSDSPVILAEGRAD